MIQLKQLNKLYKHSQLRWRVDGATHVSERWVKEVTERRHIAAARQEKEARWSRRAFGSEQLPCSLQGQREANLKVDVSPDSRTEAAVAHRNSLGLPGLRLEDVSQFRVGVRGSSQFEVTAVVARYEVDSLQVKTYSKCNLEVCTRF